MKIVGNTMGMGLPKPSLMQNDPKKGDYVKDKEEFLNEVNGGGGLPADFPVSVDENGYTQIEGLPRATSIDSVQDGNTVNMTITMQDGAVINGVLALNDAGDPVSYTEDGITCTFTHTVVTGEGS